MTRRVVFTPLAQRHLASLHDYITAAAGDIRADEYVKRIVASCKKLDQYPIRGTPRDDLLPGLRIIGFERRATIAFVVTATSVVIEGIFYGGRNFEAYFRG